MRASLGEARFAGVLVALAIGDQDSIAGEDWEVFWRTGVGHLMSISGLHVTMLASLAFAVVAFLWVRVPRPRACRARAQGGGRRGRGDGIAPTRCSRDSAFRRSARW